MHHIYTFIATYQTFYAITQHRGATVRDALEDWVRTFSFSLIEEQELLTKEQLVILKRDIAKAKPISDRPTFAGMWFVFSNLGKKEPILDGVFRIEIVDTVLPSDEEEPA